jgi:hypothetical protein
MADVLLDGTVFGLATVGGSIDPVWRLLAGTAGGLSAASADYTRTMLFSGMVRGQGTLLERSNDLSGASYGLATVTGTLGRVRLLRGSIYGTSRLAYVFPKPIWGVGTMVGFFEVFRVKPPLCCKSTIREYRWGQSFQRGDLAVWFTEVGQGAVSPYRVTYALYKGLPGGVPKLIGPCVRHPAKGDTGEYYATGIAGEGGQPGRWRIVWRYQMFYNGTVYETSMCFMVNDAIAAGACVPKCLQRKGWF